MMFSQYLVSLAKSFRSIQQGSIFRSENDIYSPPPLWKWYFSPSRDMSFFDSHRGLFALILPYFVFILPFFFPFSHFLSPFFLFLLIFPLFLFPFSYFFPKMTSADIFPPPWGGYFPIYRPLPYNTVCVKSPMRLSSSRRENLVRLDVCLTISLWAGLLKPGPEFAYFLPGWASGTNLNRAKVCLSSSTMSTWRGLLSSLGP